MADGHGPEGAGPHGLPGCELDLWPGPGAGVCDGTGWGGRSFGQDPGEEWGDEDHDDADEEDGRPPSECSDRRCHDCDEERADAAAGEDDRHSGGAAVREPGIDGGHGGHERAETDADGEEEVRRVIVDGGVDQGEEDEPDAGGDEADQDHAGRAEAVGEPAFDGAEEGAAEPAEGGDAGDEGAAPAELLFDGGEYGARPLMGGRGDDRHVGAARGGDPPAVRCLAYSRTRFRYEVQRLFEGPGSTGGLAKSMKTAATTDAAARPMKATV